MAKARDTIKETLDHNRKGYRNGRKEPEVVVSLVRKRLVRKRLVRKKLVKKMKIN
jgi:hypothetical protein